MPQSIVRFFATVLACGVVLTTWLPTLSVPMTAVSQV
jgi:hypothetical protein